jgi:AcrR family transcriptional regulator
MARGRTNDPEGTRQRLIGVAFEQFVTRGYTATAVQDVKVQAGVSSGALSHHFPHKQDLVLAVITGPVADAIETTWIAPVCGARDAGTGIAFVFREIIDELEAKGSVTGCPLNNLALELSGEGGAVRAALDGLFRRWRSALAEKFRADRTRGLFAHVEPEAAACFVIAAYSGAMAMAKAAQEPEPLTVALGEIERYLAASKNPVSS